MVGVRCTAAPWQGWLLPRGLVAARFSRSAVVPGARFRRGEPGSGPRFSTPARPTPGCPAHQWRRPRPAGHRLAKESSIRIFLSFAGVIIAIVILVCVGLSIRPRPFPPFPETPPSLATVPLPRGLPAPVERFYRTVYGDSVPLIENVVMTGRATIRPMLNIPLPARFVFAYSTGRDYRHYFEATFFGLPFLKVNEGYLDGQSFFESPMGTYYDDANTNQAANLALWAEGAMFPAILVTDPRVRWEPLDDRTALLFVPYGDREESFVVRFNPQTAMIDAMEAMRYRDPGEGHDKILWITRNEDGPRLEGSPLSAVGSATWLDQGRPWAVFTVESIVHNVDLGTYIRRRGR